MFNRILLFIFVISTVLTQLTSSTWSRNNFMLSANKFGMFSESVSAGAILAVDECQQQFKWDRWNCPNSSVSIFNENRLPTVIPEVSFLNAITSAGVMYTLTLNCSMGHFKGCACDKSQPNQEDGQNFKWGGCSDNVAFGERLSRQYVDELETGQDARAIVNLHNNEAGRRAVKKTLKLSCKCHGVSGSCALKTCWKELSEFKAIGDYLKRKFSKSVMVDAQNGQLRRGSNTQRRGERDLPQISKFDLVYLEQSPDFCKNNSAYGTKGTTSRECSRPQIRTKETRWENKSCKRLCNSCGMRVKRVLVQETTTCNCKFHWCCEVRCEECTRVVEKLTCVPH